MPDDVGQEVSNRVDEVQKEVTNLIVENEIVIPGVIFFKIRRRVMLMSLLGKIKVLRLRIL